MRSRNRRVSRWLFGHDARPPGLLRLAFFVAGLVVLGATYAVTQSEGLQVLALFALTFGMLPALSRRFGRRDAWIERRGRPAAEGRPAGAEPRQVS